MRANTLTICVLLVCTFQVFSRTSDDRVADIFTGLASSASATVDAKSIAALTSGTIADTLIEVLTNSNKLAATCDGKNLNAIMEEMAKLMLVVTEKDVMAFITHPEVIKLIGALGLTKVPADKILDLGFSYFQDHYAEMCPLLNEFNLEITGDNWNAYGNSVGTTLAKIIATYKPDTPSVEVNFLQASTNMDNLKDFLTGTASATAVAGIDLTATMKCFDENIATELVHTLTMIADKYANCSMSATQEDKDMIIDLKNKVNIAQNLCIIMDPALRQIFNELTRTSVDWWAFGAKVISYYYLNKAEICSTLAQIDVDAKASDFNSYGAHAASQWLKMIA